MTAGTAKCGKAVTGTQVPEVSPSISEQTSVPGQSRWYQQQRVSLAQCSAMLKIQLLKEDGQQLIIITITFRKFLKRHYIKS